MKYLLLRPKVKFSKKKEEGLWSLHQLSWLEMWLVDIRVQGDPYILL